MPVANLERTGHGRVLPEARRRRGAISLRAFTERWRSLLVPVFVAAQILVVHTAAGGEHPPLPPAPARFPAEAGQWKLIRQDPLDPEIAAALNADFWVNQTYLETPTRSFASLLLVWYQTQRGGVRQPHSPRMCLPGWGWTPQVVDELTVGTVAGAITVNRYVVAKGDQRAVVLYWYQTPRRVVASEWAAKFWIPADALRDQRTDTALVRIVVWSTQEGDRAATAVAARFARDLYPKLREYLPR
jgi:EpsI family protein